MNEAIVDVSVGYSDDSGKGKEFVYGECIGEIVRCADCKWFDRGSQAERSSLSGSDVSMAVDLSMLIIFVSTEKGGR